MEKNTYKLSNLNFLEKLANEPRLKEIFDDEKIKKTIKIITDLKNNQKNLSKYFEMLSIYKLMVDHMPVYIFKLDLNGNIRYANHEIPGYKCKQTMNTNISDFISKNYKNDFKKILNEAKKSGEISDYTIPIETKTGPRWWYNKLIPIKERKKIIGFVDISTDVTKYKEAVKELGETEEKYKILFDEALDAIIVIENESWKIVDCNNAAQTLTLRKKNELIGETFNIIFPNSTTINNNLKHIEKGKIIDGQIITKIGELKDVTIKYSQIQYKRKKLIQGIIRDVTEKKSAEEKIKKSEMKYRSLIEAANDAIIISDTKTGIIIEANKKAGELLGLSEKKIIGMHKGDFHPKEDFFLDILPTDASQMKNNDTIIQEATIINKMKMKIPVEVSTSIINIPPGISLVLEIYRDLTERKQANMALRDSEKKFRTIFDKSADAAFIYEIGGNFIEVNQVTCERLGYSREELLNMNPMDIDTPENIVKIESRSKVIQEKGVHIFETTHFTKDGKVIPTEVNASIIKYNGKNVVHSICRDITERKQAAKALRESEEKYRRLVEEHQMLFGQWI